MIELDHMPRTKFSLGRDDDPSKYLVLKRVTPLTGTHDAWVDVPFDTLQVGDVVRWSVDPDKRFAETDAWLIAAIPPPPTNIPAYILCDIVEDGPKPNVPNPGAH
jgi:hypothetical protein